MKCMISLVILSNKSCLCKLLFVCEEIKQQNEWGNNNVNTPINAFNH